MPSTCSVYFAASGDLYVTKLDSSYTYGIARILDAANLPDTTTALDGASYFGAGNAYNAVRFSYQGSALYTASSGYVLRVCGQLPTAG